MLFTFQHALRCSIVFGWNNSRDLCRPIAVACCWQKQMNIECMYLYLLIKFLHHADAENFILTVGCSVKATACLLCSSNIFLLNNKFKMFLKYFWYLIHNLFAAIAGLNFWVHSESANEIGIFDLLMGTSQVSSSVVPY